MKARRIVFLCVRVGTAAMAAMLASCDRSGPTPPTQSAGTVAAPFSSPLLRLKVGGITVPQPNGWLSAPPARMGGFQELRRQDTDLSACVIVFERPLGSIEAICGAWRAKVQPAGGETLAAPITPRIVNGLTVHTVELSGSFSEGEDAQPTMVHTNWMVRGAVIELPGGVMSVRMSGPATKMASLAEDWETVISGLRAE